MTNKKKKAFMMNIFIKISEKSINRNPSVYCILLSCQMQNTAETYVVPSLGKNNFKFKNKNVPISRFIVHII